MSFRAVLEAVVDRQDLDQTTAKEAMGHLLSGNLDTAVVGGFLIAMRMKGATGAELAGFAEAMGEHAVGITAGVRPTVDTCGTGGGAPSFNISTGAAIVAAAAGARVAKHGNRAVTSQCGSADVLEALGVKLAAEPERLAKILDDVGVAFFFAPHHHPALGPIGAVRRALGVRTVFNQLGPLANPAGADRRLIGVFDSSLLMPMAEALRLLGVARAFVVHGEDGLDEVSPTGPTQVVSLEKGALERRTVTPGDFGIQPVPMAAIAPGRDVAENAAILEEALTDLASPRAQALIPGAAVAIHLVGLAADLRAAAGMAATAIQSGAARQSLRRLVAETNLP